MKYLIITFTIFFLVPGCKKTADKSLGTTEINIKARDVLSDEQYKTLMVDFVYDVGYPPSEDAVNNLRSFLNARLNKPGGIQIVLRQINGSGGDNISLEQVKEIERKNRSYFSQGSFLGVFIYFANSEYAGNSGNNKVLGTNYGPTSIVMYGKSIKSISGGIGKPTFATVETAVSEHEFGHVMGLVEHGTPMVSSHMDTDHTPHCNNSACLMYYMVETNGIVGNLIGSSVPALDNNCLADLRNNGGK